MTKCQALRKLWHLELFWWGLLWQLAILLGRTSQKTTLYKHGGKRIIWPRDLSFSEQLKIRFFTITNWKLGYFPVLPTEKSVFPKSTQACSSHNNTWLWHCPPEPSCNWNQDLLPTPNFPKPSKNWQKYCSREVSRPKMFGSGDHALKRLI